MKLSHAFPLAATFVALGLSLQQPVQPVHPSETAGQARPNFVVIVTDDQDADSLPVMRKLLSYPEGSWINFSNAFANDSICCPSRATLLTGQYSHHHGVLTNESCLELDDRQTLPVWLDRAGYRTALFGKYLNRYPAGAPPGWDVFQPTTRSKNIDRLGDQAVGFLNNTASPFFLYVGFKSPHRVAIPPARYRTTNAYVPPDRPNFNEADVSDKPRWVRGKPLLSGDTLLAWQKERLNGQRELLAVDDNIQRIIDALKAGGQLNNTVVIFISDNGFSFGSHRLVQKTCQYEECVHVPLLIRYPGAAGNRVEARFVSNVDMAVTIAALAGATPTIPLDGRSLRPLLTGPSAPWDDVVLLEDHTGPPSYGIRVPGWKYVEHKDGFKELYDLTHDPYELQNVAGRPAYQARQAELAAQLHGMLD
jgi:arylsulfatase A-like enzyme